MKPGRIISSILILLGLLAGTAVPVAHAQGTPAITFHIYNSHGMTTPADAEGLILVDGILETDQSGYGAFLVENICEGTGCTSQDIYYKISLVINWTSDWGHDYPTWNVAPVPQYYMGGTEAYLHQVELGYCGGPTGESGSCEYDLEGTIPASDISEDPEDPHEMFMLAYVANYGGLHISAAYSITLSTSPILNVEAPCSGQYNIGSSLGTITLNANDSAGRFLSVLGLGITVPIGDYYMVQVTGAWKNNGTGPDLRRTAIRHGTGGAWNQLNSSSAECADVDNYYLQNSGLVYFRVYDTDGVFSTNTGSLTLTIFGITARTRYPSGCELQYETGAFIEQKTVNANSATGTKLQSQGYKPWNPGATGGDGGGEDKLYSRYYMLETIGGPAYTASSTLSYGADLGLRDSDSDLTPDTWYEISSAPFVECVVQTDMVGHVRVYFAMDEQITKTEFLQYYYAFRVRDTGSYSDNTGSLGYNLYQASYMQMTTPGVAPDADGCASYNHESAVEATITIQGNSVSGTLIPPLTNNAIYAFEVTGGPWKDNGVDSYGVEVSDDNGNSWAELEDYSNLLCASSTDGNHTLIYLYAAAGQIWRARVHDFNSNYDNNTLSIGMNIYAGLSTINYFPSCEDDYNLSKTTLTDEQRRIPGNDAAGKELTGSILGATGRLIPGSIYAIEITDESKWYEAGAGSGSYLLDISDDGGTTWVHLEDYSNLCGMQIGDGNRYKIFFTAQSSNYKLRVRDGDADFLSNTGWVMYNLYLGVNIVNPPTPGPGSTGTPPPEWVVACNESYSRPDSFISWLNVSIAGISASFPIPRVGDWIEYLKNSITFYFAWCPQHTEALRSTGEVYMDREPFASIQSYIDFIKGIQTTLEGYQAAGGEDLPVGLTSQEPDLFSDTQYIGQAGGSDSYKVPSAAGPWDLFTIGGVNMDTSVWFGGQLDLTTSIGQTDLSGMSDYQDACTEKITPLFGIVATQTCSLLSLFRYSKITSWILLVIDLLIIFWFFINYMPANIKKWIKMLENI